MKSLISLHLNRQQYEILEQMLVQALGYPIKCAEEKLGFSRENIKVLLDKIQMINRGGSNQIFFEKEEVIELMRAVAIAFIETDPSGDLSIVTGYSEKQVQEMYRAVSAAFFSEGKAYFDSDKLN